MAHIILGGIYLSSWSEYARISLGETMIEKSLLTVSFTHVFRGHTRDRTIGIVWFETTARATGGSVLPLLIIFLDTGSPHPGISGETPGKLT